MVSYSGRFLYDGTVEIESNSESCCFENDLYRMAFIGEIYSDSIICDVEHFLSAFVNRGMSLFAEIEGAYSCAIFDKHSDILYLVRDKLGSKPLYYCNTERGTYFASDIKAILAKSGIPKEIDRDALSQYFQLTYIPAPLTIYHGIQKVMPASCITITNVGIKKQTKYWSLKDDSSKISVSNYESAKSELRERVFQSAKSRLDDVVENGVLLSGGFDSTIILGVLSKLSNKPINTFTVASPDKKSDESNLAEIVAHKHHSNHHSLLLDWNAAREELPQILDNLDEPYADSSLIACYTISKHAKQYTNVLFTGDGGDEVFAGYNKYLVTYYMSLYNKLPKFIRSGVVSPLLEKMPAGSYKLLAAKKFIHCSQMDELNQRIDLMLLGFKPEILSALMIDGYVNSLDVVRACCNEWPELDSQAMAQFIDYNIVLEGDMLRKSYYASNPLDITIRSPILDEHVVAYSFALPTQYKIHGKKRKIIFKDAFQDMIPEQLYHVPKHGFGVPMYYWLKEDLKQQLLKFADRDFLEAQGLFRYDVIQSIINSHITGNENHFSALWAFYVFQSWYTANF